MSGFLGSPVRNLRLETFDGYGAWDGHSGSANPQHTRVGSFSAFGAAGSGHSVVGDTSRLQVRGDSDMAWGRYDTDALGGKWLDSNDNLGMRWEVTGVGKFDALAFFVLDAADVGGRFSIKVGDTLYSDLAGAGGRLANGNIHFVRILLSEPVDVADGRADAQPHQRRLRHRRGRGRPHRADPAAARRGADAARPAGARRPPPPPRRLTRGARVRRAARRPRAELRPLRPSPARCPADLGPRRPLGMTRLARCARVAPCTNPHRSGPPPTRRARRPAEHGGGADQGALHLHLRRLAMPGC